MISWEWMVHETCFHFVRGLLTPKRWPGKDTSCLGTLPQGETTGGVRTTLWVDAMSQGSVEKAFVTISESIKLPGVTFEDEKSRVRFVLEQLSDWPKYVDSIIVPHLQLQDFFAPTPCSIRGVASSCLLWYSRS